MATSKEGVQGIMGTTMEKIREMVDTDTIIGKPVKVGEDTTILTISKVSFGFASGGSDLPIKNPKELFGGGGGAGVSIQPVAFIVVTADDVKLLQINASPTNQAFNLIPEVLDKIVKIVKKDKPKTAETTEEE
jgi:sporulation protein YtfJ